MPQFTGLQVEKLRDYLYESCIHDSVFEKFMYDSTTKTVTIKTSNLINNANMEMVFIHVKLMVCINDDKWGFNQAISSLTVEFNSEKMNQRFDNGWSNFNEDMHFVFQLFSGNEIHILCSELLIRGQRDGLREL